MGGVPISRHTYQWKRRTALIKHGLCVKCGWRGSRGYTCCDVCREKQNFSQNALNWTERDEALAKCTTELAKKVLSNQFDRDKKMALSLAEHRRQKRVK